MSFKRKNQKMATALAVVMTLSCVAPLAHAEKTYQRIAGRNRVETSIQASKLLNSKTAVIASGYSFADALSAYNIAASKNAKLFLVDSNTDITGELRANAVNKVYVVGGENTVSSKVVNMAKRVTPNVERVAGTNRYKTNDKTLDIAGYTKVGVADGRNYPDALAASGLLKAKGLGLKLVDGSKNYASKQKVDYTFGSYGSVRMNNGKRLGGKNRYDTNLAINRELGNVKTTTIASGTNFADALSAINVVNANNPSTVTLLGNSANNAQKNYLNGINKVYVIGGAVSDYTVKDALGIGGRTNTNTNVNNNTNTNTTNNTNTNNNTTNPSRPVNPSANNGMYYAEYYTQDGTKVGKIGPVKYRNDVINGVPSGYYKVTTIDDMDSFKLTKDQSKPIYNRYIVKKLPTAMNQEQFDRDLFEQLKNGGLDPNKEYNLNAGVKINPGIKAIAEGIGFEMELLEGNPSKIRWDARLHGKDQKFNTAFIDDLINKSGAKEAATDTEKAMLVGKYIKYTFVYNSDTDNFSDDYDRSPNSLAEHKTAVCEGYVFAFNQALLRLNIPASYYNDTKHMESLVLLNGNYDRFNPTGYEQKSHEIAKEKWKTHKEMDNYILLRSKVNESDYYVSPGKRVKEINAIKYLYK